MTDKRIAPVSAFVSGACGSFIAGRTAGDVPVWLTILAFLLGALLMAMAAFLRHLDRRMLP